MEFIQPPSADLHKYDDPMKRFFNKAQRDHMIISAHSSYVIASRGLGKSEGIDAAVILRNVWEMPGSTGAMLSPTYSKAWGNTLPAICHALSTWGYIEGVHYYVGRRAPADANFKLPKRMPLRDAWSNCFHFWNGTIMVVLSFNQGMSANSMSLDWIIGPEAKFLSYDKIKSEVNPANRGNRQYFGNCTHHHSVFYSTDMPTSKIGKWIIDKEKEMSNSHINYIRTLYKEMIRFKMKSVQTDYDKRMEREIRADIELARKFQRPVKPTPGKEHEYTVYYAEYDIFDNLEVVGKDFIWQMFRDTPTLIWRTAFMNERLFRVPNGFYSALTDEHFSIPGDNGNLQNLDVIGVSKKTNWAKLTKSGCLGDGDLDLSKPLHIACDANSAISTLVVGQVNEATNELRVLKSFYIKTPGKLQDVAKMFCDYYANKLKKEVVFYFDHTFIWTSGTMSDSYADTIINVLTTNHYVVTPQYIGQSAGHDWKHLQIDSALKYTPGYLSISFNLDNNDFLKLAMEQTGVKPGKTGFEKDKDPEKLPDTPDNPDEHKTHVTDAFDTLFIGCQFHYVSPDNSSDFGAVFIGVA